ncbi:MAG: hypothetical protein ACOZBW_09865 [Thermodesulfobacteriota bacterium]
MRQDIKTVFKAIGLGLMIGAAHLTCGCGGGLSRPQPYPAMEKKAFAGEIARLERELSRATTPGTKGRILIQMVMLYTHPDNPSPDYKKALSCMEEYVRLRQSVDARYMLSLLGQLDACMAKSGTLGQENRKLKQQVDALEKENRDHEAVIEKLKRLDIQLERKRKNMQ